MIGATSAGGVNKNLTEKIDAIYNKIIAPPDLIIPNVHTSKGAGALAYVTVNVENYTRMVVGQTLAQRGQVYIYGGTSSSSNIILSGNTTGRELDISMYDTVTFYVQNTDSATGDNYIHGVRIYAK